MDSHAAPRPPCRPAQPLPTCPPPHPLTPPHLSPPTPPPRQAVFPSVGGEGGVSPPIPGAAPVRGGLPPRRPSDAGRSPAGTPRCGPQDQARPPALGRLTSTPRAKASRASTNNSFATTSRHLTGTKPHLAPNSLQRSFKKLAKNISRLTHASPAWSFDPDAFPIALITWSKGTPTCP